MSPGRGGAKTGSTCEPTTSQIDFRSSSRLHREPEAMLQVSIEGLDRRDARKFASTMSSTYAKSRDVSPSPLMVGLCPWRTAVMNRGTTAAYSDAGSWPGPYTLK